MTQLTEKILNLIKDRPGTSFIEIREIEGCKGNMELFFSTDKVDNIVLWSGLSKEAIESINELRKEKWIRMEPSTPLVYLIDGGGLRYPLAKKARAYKEPHWLPVVFWPEEKAA